MGLRRRIVIIGTSLAMAALAGCVAPGPGGPARAVPVLEGAVNIGLPPGFCADPRSGRKGPDTAVVIMGRCPGETRAAPAVVTVAVGVPGSAGVMAADGQDLAAFFASPRGRATLSASGRPGDVRLLTALRVDEAFVMRLQDRSAGAYWRAVLGLSGRLVTISVRGGPDMALSEKDGRKILDAAISALRAANAG